MADLSNRLGGGKPIHRKVEQRIANLSRGSLVRGSGKGISVATQQRIRRPGGGAAKGVACVVNKGDVRGYGNLVLFESKATESDSVRVTREWLEKISREAAEQRRIPALVVSFEGRTVNAVSERDWVCMPATVFNDLMELWIEKRGKTGVAEEAVEAPKEPA